MHHHHPAQMSHLSSPIASLKEWSATTETLSKKATTVGESSQDDVAEDKEIEVILRIAPYQTKRNKNKLNKSNYLIQTTTSREANIDNKQVKRTKNKKGVSKVKHMSCTSGRRKKRKNKLKKWQLLI